MTYRSSHALPALRRPECGSHPDVRWYVVRSHPRQETAAALQLRQQGFEPYVPMVARQLRIGTLIAPLFPQYLFVAFDKRRQRWQAINSTFGVQRLFASGPEHPTPLRDGVVEAIKAGEEKRLVVRDLVPVFIEAGAAVRITDGPLVDRRGVCRWDAGTRVRVLLSMFGRETEVTLPRQQVAPAT